MSTSLKHADRPFSISNQSALCLGKGEQEEVGVFAVCVGIQQMTGVGGSSESSTPDDA